MNLSSSSISIWTMTVPVIGLFSIIALNRASLSTIEWPQKWPRQDTEDVAQWNELFFEGAFLNHRSSYVYHTRCISENKCDVLTQRFPTTL